MTRKLNAHEQAYFDTLHSKTDEELVKMVEAYAQSIIAYKNLFGEEAAQSIIDGANRGIADIYMLAYHYRPHLNAQMDVFIGNATRYSPQAAA
ncbi:MAG: hypothetical protein GY841_10235 [FCB group bacterium]|nr:hypothetical protein [FCB group bacterium]